MCPTIISSRSRGKGFSYIGETTKSKKEVAKGKALEQNATRHY
jgi:hypothetical protein